MHEDLIVSAMASAESTARRIGYPVLGDEAISIAYCALVELAPRFDSARGVGFWAFARPRVIGALQDAMRAAQPLGNFRTTGKLLLVELDADEAPQISDARAIESSNVDVVRAARALRRSGWRTYAVAQMLAAGWDDEQIRQMTRMSDGSLGATKTRVVRLIREELTRPLRRSRSRLVELAARRGVAERTVRGRIERGVGLDKAYRLPGLTIDGVTLPVCQWARQRGMNKSTLMNRIWEGIEPKKALLAPIERGGWGLRRDARAITIEGVTKTARGWAVHFGLKPATVNRRLRSGYPIEIVFGPLMRKRAA